MPALKPTEIVGTITWLGLLTHRDKVAPEGETRDQLELGFDGIKGSAHAGVNRPSCSRVLSQHPRGTEIRNVRQLSIVSAEELAIIAEKMGLSALDPADLGTSVVVKGIPDFSHLPPSSRLQTAAGTTLVVDMENRSCQQPALTIEARHPGHGKAFKSAAAGLRGVTAWVERPGALTLGDTLTLHVPDQPAWAP